MEWIGIQKDIRENFKTGVARGKVSYSIPRLLRCMFFVLFILFLTINVANAFIVGDLVCSTSNVNLRSGPGKEYSVTKIIGQSTTLKVLEKEINGWVKIQEYNGQSATGYISMNYLIICTDSTNNSSIASKTHTKNNEGLLRKIQKSQDWLQIEYWKINLRDSFSQEGYSKVYGALFQQPLIILLMIPGYLLITSLIFCLLTLLCLLLPGKDTNSIVTVISFITPLFLLPLTMVLILPFFTILAILFVLGIVGMLLPVNPLTIILVIFKK